ncbi:hypothetical protein [Spiroplasma endosymbiont of Labia minor]|uniref:hypothetical protein n=1 Tax=Spiroplasma endosymbiont of Labia minor TaxID=3066305 RepID=UPI0030D0AAA0
MFGINNESIKGDKKYSKLLNNLLAIKGRNQSIFTKVNSVDSFDVTSKFSKSISDKILKQKQFILNLEE